jgi:hypothetical protein
MKTTLHAVSLSLLLALASAAAVAQKVYRCGPDGREYSQTPCPAGRELDVADPRSEAQRREAREAAAGEARLAKDLQAERRTREREAAARGTGLAGIRKPAAPEAASGAKPAAEKKSNKKKSGPGKPAQADGKASAPSRP